MPFLSYSQDSINATDSISVSVNDSLNQKNKDSLDQSIFSPSAVEEEVQYKSDDSVVVNLSASKVELYENAEVDYGSMKLNAGKIEFNWGENLVYAEGIEDSSGKKKQTPIFNESGTEYRAKSMSYNFKSKRGKLFEIITQEGEGIIHGEEVKKDENNIIYAKGAKYTTCDLEHPHYYFAINKMKIIPDDKILSGPAYAVLGDVPMPVALPFGFFPNSKRQASGIIIPAPGESQDRGFFLQNGGYYFGFSDKFDETLTGDLYSNGSWRLNSLSRYATRYRYRGSLELQYANNRFGDPESSDFRVDRDIEIRWRHTQDSKARPNSNFSSNLNFVTRNSQRNNSNDVNDIIQQNINSSIAYSTRFNNTPLNLTLGATHNQDLGTGAFNISLPNANLSLNRQNPLKNSKIGALKQLNFNYSLDFENQLQTFDSLLFRNETLDEFNYGFRHRIPVNTQVKMLKHFTLNPNFTYNGYNYAYRFRTEVQQVQGLDEDSTEILVDSSFKVREYGMFMAHEYNMGANLNTQIYGFMNINALGIVALRHVMSPTIGFNYRPDFSRPNFGYYDTYEENGNEITYSLYEDNIFGGPGRGEQGNLNFALDNNVEIKVKEYSDTGFTFKKVRILENLRFNTSYNLLADSLKLSNINITARTTILNFFNVQADFRLDPYVQREVEGRYVRVDVYELEENGRIGRLTNATLSLRGSFNPKVFKSKKEKVQEPRYSYGIWNAGNYVDFSLPWDLSMNYRLTYNKANIPEGDDNLSQQINASGNVKLTEKWRLGFNANYNISEKQFTTSSLNIHRDLHCWEMSINWIPFGTRSSYFFQINIKASMLQDLKIEKKQNFFDASR